VCDDSFFSFFLLAIDISVSRECIHVEFYSICEIEKLSGM
jgi:hypothetical protein